MALLALLRPVRRSHRHRAVVSVNLPVVAAMRRRANVVVVVVVAVVIVVIITSIGVGVGLRAGAEKREGVTAHSLPSIRACYLSCAFSMSVTLPSVCLWSSEHVVLLASIDPVRG